MCFGMAIIASRNGIDTFDLWAGSPVVRIPAGFVGVVPTIRRSCINDMHDDVFEGELQSSIQTVPMTNVGYCDETSA